MILTVSRNQARKWLLSAYAGLLTITLLAACGDSVATPTVIPPTPVPTVTPTIVELPPATPTTAAQAGNVVKHALGETTVPADPQRVLALGEEGLLSDLLSADVPVIASSVNVPDSVPGIDPARLEGIELFSSTGDTSIEHLAELKPDLIVTTQYWAEQIGYSTLSQIAPTVAVGAQDPLGSYVETLSVFGQQVKAEQAVADIRARVQSEGQKLNSSGRTVSIATIYPGAALAAWVGGPTLIPQMVEDLGFKLRPSTAEAGGLSVRSGRAYISLEQMTLFDGDTLIMLQSSAVEGELEAVTEVQANPLWQTVPAVQQNRVVTLDRLGYPGFSGYERLLDDLAQALAAP